MSVRRVSAWATRDLQVLQTGRDVSEARWTLRRDSQLLLAIVSAEDSFEGKLGTFANAGAKASPRYGVELVARFSVTSM